MIRRPTKTALQTTQALLVVVVVVVLVVAATAQLLVIVLAHQVAVHVAVRLVLLRLRVMTLKKKHMVEIYTCQRLTENPPRKLPICRAK